MRPRVCVSPLFDFHDLETQCGINEEDRRTYYNDTLQAFFDMVAKKIKEVQVLENYTIQLWKQSQQQFFMLNETI